jgi:polysaccharide export outer membrane protein
MLTLALSAPAAIAAKSSNPPAPAHGAPVDSMADSTVDWSQVPEYRIVPGDKLLLNFGPAENTARGFAEHEVKVRTDGRISVFPVGDVIAAGHTPRELEAILVDLMSASLKQPRVTVEVEEIAGNQVHVLGRVMKPGSFPADPYMTVVQAITAAGGFSDDAARNSVLVFHRIGRTTISVSRLQLDHMMKTSGGLKGDMALERFDIVYVPRNTVGNIGTFVTQLFGSLNAPLTTALLGWELFNLERVFPGAPVTRP